MTKGEAVVAFGDDLRRRIVENLEEFSAAPGAAEGLRRAAVALVVTRHPVSGEAALLLTLRPLTLNRHGGQYALPGGRLDEGETTIEAALRELHEELGVRLGEEAVLGHLDDYPTRSGFCMTPVVAWGGADLVLDPDPGEVARTFHVPLAEIDSPSIPELGPVQENGRRVLRAFLPELGHYIAAPTAAILYQFREVALRGQPTRVAHYDQPEFAWK